VRFEESEKTTTKKIKRYLFTGTSATIATRKERMTGNCFGGAHMNSAVLSQSSWAGGCRSLGGARAAEGKAGPKGDVEPDGLFPEWFAEKWGTLAGPSRTFPKIEVKFTGEVGYNNLSKEEP
jgi:hypothetical protein